MNKTFYKVAFSLAMIGMTALPTTAAIRYSLADFEKETGSMGFGTLKVGDQTFFRATTAQDFKLGPLALGVDINGYIPLSGGGHYPTDLELITVRSIAYDHDNVAGFKYGRLTNVTLGYGLLIDNYDSGLGGDTSIFSNKKAGVKAYAKAFGVRGDAMATLGNLYAGRISGEVPEFTVFGTPVILGINVASDGDGLDTPVDGGTVTRPGVTGYGADIGLPIAGDFLTAYVEYAALTDHSNGMSTGIKGDFFGLASYRMEYQALQAGFVPGYFNTTYEATSFDFDTDAPKQSINGFLGNVAVAIPSSPFKAGLQIESYTDRSLLTAAVGWTKIGNTTGVINYTQPFQNASNPVLDSSILYQTGGLVDYVVNYKRVYYASDLFTESYDIGLRFNPNKLLPGIF